ncbi:conserved hypothetical protein [Clostridium botulinum C str. Eklund]|nr:conserved hypothetical protein [Clostridium botulinum C str. Eklund]NEZ49260.1 ASCH domain-containing protein [Clostridium botulinum]
MKKSNKTVEKIWRDYLKSTGEDIKNTEKKYSAWSFGQDSDELLELVLKGEKTATTSLHYWYDGEEEELPKVGELSIVMDSNYIAKCIIETRKVDIIPFCNVSKEFAFKEGEGDKSLEYWRRVHINFFDEELKEVGKKFIENILVVCEEFKVVYK